MNLKVIKSLHFYITFLGLILFSWPSHYRNYLINTQYQTFSIYLKLAILLTLNKSQLELVILLTLKKSCHFADFEQVIIKISHFADFEQVIISHFVKHA